MTEVVKRDGRREPFDADKIRVSIEAAARESKIPDKRARQVTEKVANRVIKTAETERKIETRKIKERVLKELDAVEPAMSRAWRNFDKAKVRTS